MGSILGQGTKIPHAVPYGQNNNNNNNHSSKVRGSRYKEERLENAGTNTKNAEWEKYPQGILG